MNNWGDLYINIIDAINSFGNDILFFRGHGDSAWKLRPNISRYAYRNDEQRESLEGITFFDYKTKSGRLINESCSAWDLAFSMQHHGLPTRLLDWSENFSVALYFALKGASRTHSDCCVWILDPFCLNADTVGREALFHVEDLDLSYREYFIDCSDSRKRYGYEDKVVAISPLRHSPRLFNQCSGFTLHFNLDYDLEKESDFLKKIVIPRNLHDDAWNFLKLAGISEYSLFPDLDGLSRDLMIQHYMDLDFIRS